MKAATKRKMPSATPAPVKRREPKYEPTWPIAKLRLWQDNPRENEQASKKLATLFEQFGFVNPVIADYTGAVWAGHTRIKAAILQGRTTVPVLFYDFKDDEEAKSFAISDNVASEWATWNKDKLRELFGQISNDVAMVAKRTGFNEKQIEYIGVGSAPKKETFRNVVAKFEEQATTQVENEFFAWVQFKDAAQMNAVLDKIGRKDPEANGAREIDTIKLLNVCGIAAVSPEGKKQAPGALLGRRAKVVVK